MYYVVPPWRCRYRFVDVGRLLLFSNKGTKGGDQSKDGNAQKENEIASMASSNGGDRE